MTVLLLALKWIGMILLALLLLVLVLLLLVLLVPVRYRAEGSYYDKEPNIRIRVSWLLHLLHINLCFADGRLPVTVRVAGIVLLRRDFLEKELEPPLEKREVSVAAENPVKAETAADVPSVDAGKPDESASFVRPEEAKEPESREKQEEPEQKKPEQKKPSLANRLLAFWQKLILQCGKFLGKLSAAKETAQRYYKLFTRPRTRQAICFAKQRFRELLKAIAPKKYSIKLRFGMPDNPAAMGKIMMYLSLLYPFVEEHAELIPDFENSVIEGECSFRGRIRVGTLLIIALRIWRNRDIRYVRRGLRKLRMHAV